MGYIPDSKNCFEGLYNVSVYDLCLRMGVGSKHCGSRGRDLDLKRDLRAGTGHKYRLGCCPE